MVPLSVCPKCGKECRTRSLTVKSKKGKIYRYIIYYHRRRNHSVKVQVNKPVHISGKFKTGKNREMHNGPCPICLRKRKYYIKTIKVKAKSGKVYQYTIYIHGNSRHFVKQTHSVDQIKESIRLTKLAPLLGTIMGSYTIGTRFTINELIGQYNKGKSQSYYALKDKLDELTKLNFLTRSQENGINYFSIPWSILGVIYRLIRLDISLYSINLQKIDGHNIEYTVQNRSFISIDYIPYLIITDTPVELTDLNLKVKDEDTGDFLEIRMIRNEPKEKLFYIRFKEPLAPDKITRIQIKYNVEEANMNYVFSSGLEINKFHLCLIHGKEIKVNFNHFSTDRKIAFPLKAEDSVSNGQAGQLKSCVDIDNPPKLSIIQVSWKPANQ
ncbi:MAG: hypothetical protein M1515_04065 [Candidatus Thermoplasmatota archaeon]|nr:hypothetical protein [Candidatus Thermoplasmatota archaeon]